MDNINKYAGLYYAIMNILDYIALNNVTKENEISLYKILDSLLSIEGSKIEDLADANDCGNVDNWADFVAKLKQLFENGERA